MINRIRKALRLEPDPSEEQRLDRTMDRVKEVERRQTDAERRLRVVETQTRVITRR